MRKTKYEKTDSIKKAISMNLQELSRAVEDRTLRTYRVTRSWARMTQWYVVTHKTLFYL